MSIRCTPATERLPVPAHHKPKRLDRMTNETEEQRGIRLLSFDGGGVRALSALIILHEFMQRLNHRLKPLKEILPCEWFDMIVGSGTGGLIAILLGRLGMSVEKAIEAYQIILTRAFSSKKTFGKGFKASELENAVDLVVEGSTGDVKSLMLCPKNAHDCKTFVCTMLADHMDAGLPDFIRTYEVAENQGPRCTIREAVRATTATPGLFKPVEILHGGVKVRYVGAELGNNNPTAYMLAEAERVFPNRTVSLVISIGSGHRLPISDSRSPSTLGMEIATDSDGVAQGVAQQFRNTSNLYFRFNVGHGLEHIEFTSGQEMSKIPAHTRKYIQTADEQLKRAVDAALTQVGPVSTAWLSGTIPLTGMVQSLTECPPPSPVFTGREDILTEMYDSIFNDLNKRHVFVLHGLGGAGKTQLALKFSDVFYIDATSAATIQRQLKNIALAKKVGTTDNDTIAWLAGPGCPKNWLIIYNNADDTTLGIQSFFPSCAHGNIIITTRNWQIVVHAQPTQAHCAVSAMSATDAKQLLCAVSHIPTNIETEDGADAIVKELGHLALAIVQAGAYICLHQCTVTDYLLMYQKHRDNLLEDSQSRVQRIDDYEWTVYTTWSVSYQKLHPNTGLLLQLLAFMHHEGISEEIFSRATAKIAANVHELSPESSWKKTRPDNTLTNFLLGFIVANGDWDKAAFLKVTGEARSYSLLDFDPTRKTYSMHPLVQSWARTTTNDSETVGKRAATLLALATSNDFDSEDLRFLCDLVPHLDALPRDLIFQPDNARVFSLVYTEAGHYKLAQALWEAVVRADRCTLGDNHLATLADMHELAKVYQTNEELDKAESLQKQIVESRLLLLGDSHPDTYRALGYLAVTYQRQARYEEALRLQIIVSAAAEQILGPDHRETLMVQRSLGRIYMCLGLFTQAAPIIVEVMKTRFQAFGINHPDTLDSMGDAITLFRNLGVSRPCGPLAERLVRTYRGLLGEAHPSTLAATDILIGVYLDQNRLPEAEGLSLRGLELRQRLWGNERLETVTFAANSLGTVRLLQNRLSEAELLWRRAIEAETMTLGSGNPRIQATRMNLAAVLSAQGQKSEAEEIMDNIWNISAESPLSQNTANMAALANNRARLYASQRRWKHARIMMQVATSFDILSRGRRPGVVTTYDQFLAEIEWCIKKERLKLLLYCTLLCSVSYLCWFRLRV
ncbi:hypothetical protein FRC09_010039 [Ceratobasidium sp. 395]|nr:hypothetical protein FRC09_010039 [Ceratobasidium sp. 395]